MFRLIKIMTSETRASQLVYHNNLGLLKPLGLFLTVMLGMTSGLANADIYRWVDEKGVPHFSEQPPKGVKKELIKKRSKSTASSQASETSTSTPVTTQQQSAGTSAAKDAKAKPKLTPAQQKMKEERCQAERDRLAALQKPGRIRMNLADGSSKYLSQEDIAAEIATTQEVIAQTCD